MDKENKDEKVTLTKEELKETLTAVSKEAAKEAVDEQVKELGLDKLPQKFTGASKEDLAKLEGKEKMVKFIKAVYSKDAETLASFKALNEGTNSAGGYIVPQEFSAEVNRIVEDFGLVGKLARKIPMATDTMNVPRLGSSVAIYYPGEGAAGTASQPVFENVQLLAKTAVGLTPMTNELLADANVDVVNLLVELFAEALAGDLDDQGLAGSGSPFTGLLEDANINVVDAPTGEDTFAEAANPDNLRDMIAKIKPWALQGAAFIMHRSVWSIIQKKKASTGGDYFVSAANPILMPNNAEQGYPNAIAGTIWGYPIYLSDKMPSTSAVSTKFILFGNLKHLYYGTREGMSVSISEHATVGSDNLFEQNMSAVRVTQRQAIAVGLPAAFSVLKTAAS